MSRSQNSHKLDPKSDSSSVSYKGKRPTSSSEVNANQVDISESAHVPIAENPIVNEQHQHSKGKYLH